MKYINNKEDGMGIYMKDVRKTDLITAEKEVELAKKDSRRRRKGFE